MRPISTAALAALRRGAICSPHRVACIADRAPRTQPTLLAKTFRVFSTAAPPEQQAGQRASSQKPAWQIRMLYDGDCPLCMREVNMLRRRDKGTGNIDFVDISSAEYIPAENAGISYEQAMGEIHAILPDGKIVTNVEVFRRLYEAVGLGWVYAVTRIEPIGRAANWLYRIWAKYRLSITGRPDIETVLREKQSCKIR